MRAKTGATSGAVRARYGVVGRFLGSLPIATTAGTISVHFYDLPGPKRVYAWTNPSDNQVVMVEHCADISSPHEAVSAARRRHGLRP
jgi:hypothetical protein